MLLCVEKLVIEFEDNKEKEKPERVVDQLSFQLKEGEILGIVGESGSGKSMTSLAIMGLLGKHAKIPKGKILFEGRDLLTLSEQEKTAYRGNEISMIFQEPMTSLNPVIKIGTQIEEVLLLHTNLSKDQRREAVYQALREVELTNPEIIYQKYPHQLSGGMRQRVMIAMAMLNRPKLLIADEPTTALDVTVQSQILSLLKRLNQQYQISIILISHDLGVVADVCKKVIVMKEGKVVETGEVKQLFSNPNMEYTKELIAAVPGKRTEDKDRKEYSSHIVAEVKDLQVGYLENRKRKNQLLRETYHREVVKGVSFSIREGEIFGIVGESGCGKSTLAKAIAGLIPSKGTIHIEGNPQMVFQDPYSSLNPCKKIGWILEEPLRVKKKERILDSKTQRIEQVEAILEEVGLPKEYKDRYIRNLSGGQRQRISIACALLTKEKFLILDEPVSALDVTVQEKLLTLLQQLRKEHKLSYLFISHDLNVVYQICDRIAVMKDGIMVEIGTREQIYYNPQHNYTKQLLRAIPKIVFL